MQNIKKYFMTLALLLTAVTGAWAQTAFGVKEITADMLPASWSTDESAVTADDLAKLGFMEVTKDAAKTWTGAPQKGNVRLIYTVCKSVNWVDGEGEYATDSYTRKIFYSCLNGQRIFITTELTEWPLTPDADKKVWTLAKMPANDIELQVEYYAESNLFLSKEALADKANIAVKNGETAVTFDDEGKSANTVTEGNTVTVTYTGTKKVLGVKAEKKAAGKTVDLSTYSGDSYEVTEDVTFTGTTNNEISILYKGNDYEVTLDNVNAPKCCIAAQDDSYNINVKLKGTSRLMGIYTQNVYIIIGEAEAGGTVILVNENTPLGSSAATITINGGTVKAKTSSYSALYDMLKVNGGAVYLEAAEDSKAVSISAEGSVTLYGWNGSAWVTYTNQRYLSTDNSKAPSQWTW